MENDSRTTRILRMNIVMNFGGNDNGVWFGLNSFNGVLEFLNSL